MYVVNGDKVSQKKVLLGKTVGTNVIIRDGLAGGEQIVVQGVQSLREGASIKIVPDSTKK